MKNPKKINIARIKVDLMILSLLGLLIAYSISVAYFSIKYPNITWWVFMVVGLFFIGAFTLNGLYKRYTKQDFSLSHNRNLTK